MRKEADKPNVRQRLLDQGVKMLMEGGYHGTGLQELLGSVGVPKGSFYNYFRSKEDFGVAVIGHYIEPFIRRLDELLGQSSQDGLGALRRYFEELIEATARNGFVGGCLLGNLIGEIGDTNDTCRTALRDTYLRYRNRLADGIAQAQSEGTLRNDLDATVMADQLADAWQGALLRMKIEQSDAPLRACIDHLLGGYFRPQT